MSFESALSEHLSLFATLHRMQQQVEEAAQLIAKVLGWHGKVMLCGNGGSAADAQHIAAEFVGRFVKDRCPLAAIALTTDTSALTAIGNDYGYAEVFARQVEALATYNKDVLIVISTSGTSDNVLRAAKEARLAGCAVIGLIGKGGGALSDLCDVALIVPSDNTARIQEAHIFLGHMLCELTEAYLLAA